MKLLKPFSLKNSPARTIQLATLENENNDPFLDASTVPNILGTAREEGGNFLEDRPSVETPESQTDRLSQDIQSSVADVSFASFWEEGAKGNLAGSQFHPGETGSRLLLPSESDLKFHNPLLWIRMFLLEKQLIYRILDHCNPELTAILSKSQFPSSKINSALWEKTASGTIHAISKRGQERGTASLTSLKIITEMLQQNIFPSISANITANEKQGLEELDSRGLIRTTLGLGRKIRFNLLIKHANRRLNEAKKEIMGLLNVTGKHEERKVRGIKIKIDKAKQGARERGDIELTQNIQNFIVLGVLANPERFLKGENFDFDWEKIFGIKDRVVLLDTLNLYYSAELMAVGRSVRLHGDTSETLGRLEKRVTTLREMPDKLNPDFIKLQNQLTGEQIEYHKKTPSTRQMVQMLIRALCSGKNSVKKEDIFRHGGFQIQNSKANTVLSDEEKFCYLVSFLNKNPFIFKQINDARTKQSLAKYLHDLSVKVQDLRITGGVSEEGGGILIIDFHTRFKKLADIAQETLGLTNNGNLSLKDLQRNFRKRSSQDFDNIMQGVANFLTAFDNLEVFFDQIKSENPDESTKFSSPDDEKRIKYEMEQLKRLYTELQTYLEQCRAERKEYEKLLSSVPDQGTPEATRKFILKKIEIIEKDLKEAQAKQALAGNSGQKGQIGAPIMLSTDAYEKNLQTWNDRLDAFEASQVRSLPLPHFASFQTHLDRILTTQSNILKNLEPDDTKHSLPSVNEQMQMELIDEALANNVKDEFLPRLQKSSRAEAKILAQMSVGTVISELDFADVTHTEGVLHVAGAIVDDRENIQNLRIIVSEKGQVILEEIDGDRIIVFTGPINTSASNMANLMIFSKQDYEPGKNAKYWVKQNNPDQYGICLNLACKGGAEQKSSTTAKTPTRSSKFRLRNSVPLAERGSSRLAA